MKRLLFAATSVAALTAFAQSAPLKLTVEDAVRRAIDESPGLQAARLRQESTEDAARSVRGRFLPSVHLSDEQQHYDSPYSLAFSLNPAVPPAQFPVRAINTNTFAAAIDEPILQLLKIGQNHSAVLESAAAAGEAAQSVEAMIREAVQTGYLRYFEARALVDIAKTSEQQLAEQRQVAEARLKAGVLTKADLLRLEVAEANAKQQEIQAAAQRDIARSALLIALGFSAKESDVELVEPTALENGAAPQTSIELAQNTAMSKRHEVLRAQHEAEAAEHGRWAKLYSFLPDLDAEGAYTHIHGQAFAPENQFYVGVRASWAIWEWGATWYDNASAEKAARAARLAAEEESRQVRSDASTKLAQAQAAAIAVNVAQATIASAEEAYRVTDALVKAGSATTTDLLDAQSALTQAKLTLVRARYEQAVANVALTRATGG